VAYYNKRVIRHQVESFSFSSPAGGDTQHITLPLGLLGIRGQIRRVCVRADVTSVAGALNVWVFDRHGLAGWPTSGSVPPDEWIYYSNLGAAVTGSDTTAMINDHVAATGGSDYEVDPVQAPTLANLTLLVELVSNQAGGPFPIDFFATVWSEVQL
jgi:hypothetical protein